MECPAPTLPPRAVSCQWHSEILAVPGESAAGPQPHFLQAGPWPWLLGTEQPLRHMWGWGGMGVLELRAHAHLCLCPCCPNWPRPLPTPSVPHSPPCMEWPSPAHVTAIHQFHSPSLPPGWKALVYFGFFFPSCEPSAFHLSAETSLVPQYWPNV